MQGSTRNSAEEQVEIGDWDDSGTRPAEGSIGAELDEMF